MIVHENYATSGENDGGGIKGCRVERFFRELLCHIGQKRQWWHKRLSGQRIIFGRYYATSGENDGGGIKGCRVKE